MGKGYRVEKDTTREWTCREKRIEQREVEKRCVKETALLLW